MWFFKKCIILLNNFLQRTTSSCFWIKNLEATTCKRKYDRKDRKKEEYKKENQKKKKRKKENQKKKEKRKKK